MLPISSVFLVLTEPTLKSIKQITISHRLAYCQTLPVQTALKRYPFVDIFF